MRQTPRDLCTSLPAPVHRTIHRPTTVALTAAFIGLQSASARLGALQ